MKVVCVSDTHLNRPIVPDGDLLIHAGDLTLSGKFQEIASAGMWLSSLPHQHKIVIAGNHDWLFEKDNALARQALGPGVTYLQDSGTEIEGLKLWGSPWQPRFFDWAFNLDRGEPLRKKWLHIPDDVHILVTHGPPNGVLDRLPRGEHVGCEELAKRLEMLKPRLHVFGHIHCGHGMTEKDGTIYVNAALCDDTNRLRHGPIVVEI